MPHSGDITSLDDPRLGRLASDQGKLVAANLKLAISGSSKPAKVAPSSLTPTHHIEKGNPAESPACRKLTLTVQTPPIWTAHHLRNASKGQTL